MDLRPEKFGALRNAWQQGAQKRLEEAIGDQLLAEDGPDTVAPSAIVARRGNGAAEPVPAQGGEAESHGNSRSQASSPAEGGTDSVDGAGSEPGVGDDDAQGEDDKPLTERQRQLLQQTLSGFSRFASPASPPEKAAAPVADTLVSSPASLRNARIQTLKQRQQGQGAEAGVSTGDDPARPQALTQLLLQEEEDGEATGVQGTAGSIASGAAWRDEEPGPAASAADLGTGEESAVAEDGDDVVSEGKGGEVMKAVSATLLGSEWLSLTESSNLVLPSGADMLPFLIEEDDPTAPGDDPGGAAEAEDEAEQVRLLAGAAEQEETTAGRDEGAAEEEHGSGDALGRTLPVKPSTQAESPSSSSSSSSTSTTPHSEQEPSHTAGRTANADANTHPQGGLPRSPLPISTTTGVESSTAQGDAVVIAPPPPVLAPAPAPAAPAPAVPAAPVVPHRRRARPPPPPPPPRRTGGPPRESDAASSTGSVEDVAQGKSGPAPAESLANGASHGSPPEQGLPTLMHPSLGRPTRRRHNSGRKQRSDPDAAAVQSSNRASRAGQAGAVLPQGREAPAAQRRPSSSHSTASEASRASAWSGRSCKSSRWMKKDRAPAVRSSPTRGGRGPSLKHSASQLAQQYLVRAARGPGGGAAPPCDNAFGGQSPETKALAGQGSRAGAPAGARPPGRG